MVPVPQAEGRRPRQALFYAERFKASVPGIKASPVTLLSYYEWEAVLFLIYWEAGTDDCVWNWKEEFWVDKYSGRKRPVWSVAWLRRGPHGIPRGLPLDLTAVRVWRLGP